MSKARNELGVGTERRAKAGTESSDGEIEERLRLVLDAAPGGFYAVDREGNTNLVSRGFLNMLGFQDEQDALGRKLHDVIHHTKLDGAHYPVEDCGNRSTQNRSMQIVWSLGWKSCSAAPLASPSLLKS